MNDRTFVFHLVTIPIYFFILSALPLFSQIHDMRELSTVDIDTLNLSHTVIIIPEGILEQHGPYLPSYTDGYQNEYLAQGLAESIVKKDGWKVLIFPAIPLGSGGANQIAKKSVFSGTYHVHFNTLRSIFMDLASEFGEAGFKWVFIISEHGDPRHQQALDQASDFFNDTYKGTMVYLSGLVPEETVSAELNLSKNEHLENGLDVHAGMAETSAILFLIPKLVHPGYRNTMPLPGENWKDLIAIGTDAEWPGYYGAPGLATAARGELILNARLTELTNLALHILNGYEFRGLRRLSEIQMEDKAINEYVKAADEHARRIQEMQKKWLKQKGF